MIRKSSPEFSGDYELQQHVLRRPLLAGSSKAKSLSVKQQTLALRSLMRFEVVQIVDLPRFHYEVWADFDDGDCELLSRGYVRGLSNAVRMAVAKWGPVDRVVLSRLSRGRSVSVVLGSVRRREAGACNTGQSPMGGTFTSSDGSNRALLS